MPDSYVEVAVRGMVSAGRRARHVGRRSCDRYPESKLARPAQAQIGINRVGDGDVRRRSNLYNSPPHGTIRHVIAARLDPGGASAFFDTGQREKGLYTDVYNVMRSKATWAREKTRLSQR